MKIFLVVLFAFFYTVQGVPSREATHDSHTYPTRDDLSEDRLVQQISDDSYGTYGGFESDPKFEAVGYDHDHTYEDFSADVARYPEYEQFRTFEGFEDVIPREVRVSGLSLEDQDKTYYENTKHNDSTGDNNSTTERDSEDLSASAGLGEDFDMPEEEIEDVIVEGLSEYSYLVGDKLHGINEMKASGAMNGARKVVFDNEDGEEFEDFDYDVGTDDDLNYEQFLEDEDRDVQDYQYDDEYDHEDEVIVRGQAVENEDDEELEEEDFEEDDEIDDFERLEDDDYEDDDDDYDEDEDEEDDTDIGVRSLDGEDDDEYHDDDDDIYEEDDEDGHFAVRDEGENEIEKNIKGMSVTVVEDDEDDDEEEEDAEYDEEEDEYEDDMPEIGRQEDDDEDDEEDGEYEGEYIRELDDEDEDDEGWEEDNDELDSTSRDEELDEDITEIDENEASESLHGDEIKADMTEKRE